MKENAFLDEHGYDYLDISPEEINDVPQEEVFEDAASSLEQSPTEQPDHMPTRDTSLHPSPFRPINLSRPYLLDSVLPPDPSLGKAAPVQNLTNQLAMLPPRRPPSQSPTRRSSRNTKKHDYKTLHQRGRLD